ncbi:hypothetical protein AB6A40_005023 [Gnathostoma spinigerum]|uniref:Uncharacterized protein n=1 Tax=Gnathostoma spinigerum TaxID=75299 RepID=A0ABD6EE81_9BILA
MDDDCKHERPSKFPLKITTSMFISVFMTLVAASDANDALTYNDLRGIRIYLPIELVSLLVVSLCCVLGIYLNTVLFLLPYYIFVLLFISCRTLLLAEEMTRTDLSRKQLGKRFYVVNGILIVAALISLTLTVQCWSFLRALDDKCGPSLSALQTDFDK